MTHLRRDDPGSAAVALHDHADGEGRHQRDVGDVVGAELRDELRSRDRLEDVVRRHRQERVGEHHDERDALLLADVDDRSEEAAEQATHQVRMVPPAGAAAGVRPGARAQRDRWLLDSPRAADAGCGLERARREARRRPRRRPHLPLRRPRGGRLPARQAHSQRAVPRRIRRLQPRLRLRRGAPGAERGPADLRPDLRAGRLAGGHHRLAHLLRAERPALLVGVPVPRDRPGRRLLRLGQLFRRGRPGAGLDVRQLGVRRPPGPPALRPDRGRGQRRRHRRRAAGPRAGPGDRHRQPAAGPGPADLPGGVRREPGLEPAAGVTARGQAAAAAAPAGPPSASSAGRAI